jgi:hypothetical protein
MSMDAGEEPAIQAFDQQLYASKMVKTWYPWAPHSERYCLGHDFTMDGQHDDISG